MEFNSGFKGLNLKDNYRVFIQLWIQYVVFLDGNKIPLTTRSG